MVRRGWATTVDELEIGLTGVGAPVCGATGEVVAALGISGPTRGWWTGTRRSAAVARPGGAAVELFRRKTRKEGVA